MKYVILSDIQGNIEALTQFRQGMSGFLKDRIICLGDIVNKGKSYDDSRVIDILKEIKADCIRGNHEDELRKDNDYKIPDYNFQFLDELSDRLIFGNMLFFHSSLRKPGTRMKSEEDIKKEAEYLQEVHPYFELAFFGHTHEAGVFYYDPKNRDVKQLTLDQNMILEKGKKYIINSGGIGVYYGLPQTFAVFDEEINLLNFYSLDELEDMSAKRYVVLAFEEEWMPHLKGDEWSWHSLENEVGDLRKINKNGRFDEVIRILDSLKPDVPKKVRKKYFENYSLGLAQAIKKLATPDVMENYDLCCPLKTRSFYLSMNHKKKKIKGIECFLY